VQTPKVSVLVPVYNGQQNLAECFESILAQDFPDLEILVSDDGSTDNSMEIIKAFAARDARIRWWKNPRNKGLTANSNLCLSEARGQYVKFVHQDDLLLSVHALAKMVAAFDEYPNAALVGCRQHLTGTGKHAFRFSNRTGCFDGRRVIVKCLERNNNIIGQPTLTLFRRLQGRRGFDERFTGFMDFEMWCHLLEQGDFIYLDEPLATWRVHEYQQTAQTTRAQKDGTQNYEQLRFVETYYAKPWLRELATDRMLFAQIYYLRKYYGAKALPLISAMMSQLSTGNYVRQWLKHKLSRPFEKLREKLARQTPSNA